VGVNLLTGLLNQRVALQQRASGVDALGQESSTWQDVATVWAQVQPLRGREFFAAGQTQAETSMRVRIRWRAGITAAMRVVWKSQPLDIVAVIDVDGAGEQLELMCNAGTKDGRAS
jgi:SPP1 family predicted phage head-tail adaptor